MPATQHRCPACDQELSEDAQFCETCGSPTQVGMSEVAREAQSEDPIDPRDAEFEATLRSAIGSDYELGEPIGQGGFAKVFKANDVRLDRSVAIKVIRPDLAGARAFLDRFKREGVALAKLRHPGIVPIYDIRECGDLIYYVMPFIDGENLKDRLERLGRLPPFEAHRILSELSDAITAAHRSGIIHRDIKPENIILEGNLRKVLLMDFGIAKSAEAENQRLTGSGVLVGTPTYMSPEQAAGDMEIDQRADIYALGVLAYHMVVGELPFKGTPQQIMIKHITDTPTPVRELNPSVPKALSDTIARCLEKKPSERFETAMDLWRELQTVKFFANEPTQTPRPKVPKLELIAVLALLLGLFGGFAIGKFVYERLATQIVRPASVRPSPTSFVSAWLANVKDLSGQMESDSIRAATSTAFDGLGAMARVFAGSDPASPSVQLTPDQMVHDRTYVDLLARIDESRVHVRDYGETAVAVAPYSDSVSVCGTATFTLRLGAGKWELLLIQLHDSGESCTE